MAPNVKCCIIGLGYVGLPTAAVLAEAKFDVVGVDVSQTVVSRVNSGQAGLAEPGLDELIQRGLKSNKLRAQGTPEMADVFVIAVPTPINENNVPDLRYVNSATASIAPFLKSGDLVLLESTSPVGTTEEISGLLSVLRPDLRLPNHCLSNCDIFIAYCPERVLPGAALEELVLNSRTVGGITEKCGKKAKEFYSHFCKGEIHVANSARTAELTKLVENSFRDVNIAFANELSMLCNELDINVWELIKLANYHPRVEILQPGAGVGGHCIAVDPWFIVHSAPLNSKLIKMGREVNDYKSEWIFSKIQDDIEEIKVVNNIKDPNIVIYGLTFKPNIDDLRESPALRISEKIRCKYRNITIVEPYINKLPDNLKDCHHLSDASLASGDYHVYLVAHDQFKKMNPPHGKYLDVVGLWPFK